MKYKQIVIGKKVHSQLKDIAKRNNLKLSDLCTMILADKIGAEQKESEKLILREVFDDAN